jgi:hypothetical protein
MLHVVSALLTTLHFVLSTLCEVCIPLQISQIIIFDGTRECPFLLFCRTSVVYFFSYVAIVIFLSVSLVFSWVQRCSSHGLCVSQVS